MERKDKGLAFLLQYENIAWYEEGKVRILDRRIYPNEISYVVCNTHVEVMQAIKDMVTQSAGPFTAAAMGMALAAYECKDLSNEEKITYLTEASEVIANARPTTKKRMLIITKSCLAHAINKINENVEDISLEIVNHLININNKRYAKIEKMANYLVDVIPDNGKILTHCFGETIVGMTLKVAKERGKNIKVYCSETRPYFQGSRLTASVAYLQGFDVTVVSDNMVAALIETEKIDVFTSAADAICLDGYIVNKVGTFQSAIVAKYMKIPYFVTGNPDKDHPVIDGIKIEQRDPNFTTQAMGVKTTMDGVKGYYPSFDITPPSLVSGVVTEDGIYSPYDLHKFFENGNEGEYD